MATPDIQKMKKTTAQSGKIEWIGLRPEKKGAINVVEKAEIRETDGLEGDHYSNNSKKRQVTLIQAEHLNVAGALMNSGSVDPALARRNIVVSGINLLSFKDQQFHLGNEVILAMTGICHPCSMFEESLGAGGYNAMRGHGGITATVINGGTIKNGDEVKLKN